MKTHRARMLAILSSLAVALGLINSQAMAQAPLPIANAEYASFSQGRPIVQQASYSACGACDGQGCGICGVSPVAGGFRLSNLAHAGHKRAQKCAPGGGGLFGGLGGAPAAPACGPADCGPSCGPGAGGGCGILGGMGGLGAGGGMLASMQAMNASRYGGYGSMMAGTQNGPFGGGGCCTPIWYDFSIGYLNLTRDYDVPGVGLSTQGLPNLPPGVSPTDFALSTSDADADSLHGIVASYALLIGPSTNLELSYMGASGDDDRTVRGTPDGLYSVFGDFGAPRNTVAGTINGFPQTVDNAILHSVSADSDLHSLELNMRRRWVSAGCLLHGSYLAGVRYVNLQDDFNFHADVADGGFLDYDINSENEAVGVQIGGDLFVCISPRFKLGLELEGGVYGNDSSVSENINTFEIIDGNLGTNQSLNLVDGNADETDVAFVGEVNATALFKITPRLTLRGGYTFLYLDNFAVAQDHFNADSPFNNPTRAALVLNNKEEVTYHGANVGITWMW